MMVRVDVTSFDTDTDLISICWLRLLTTSVTADEENCLRHVIIGVGIPVATQVILIVSPGSTRVSSADIVTVGATEHYLGYTALFSELLHLSCQTDSTSGYKHQKRIAFFK